MSTVNVENFTEKVRNCAGKRDLIVSALMECVWCRGGTTEAGRHPHRCGCESKRFLGRLFRCLSGYVADLGMRLCREAYECSGCVEKFATLLLPWRSAGERTWQFDLMVIQY